MIWYRLEGLTHDPRTKLCATLINLLELCRTPRNLNQIDVARTACQQLIQRNKGICVYSPAKSIAVASGFGIEDGNESMIRDCITFIAGIADGDEIDATKRELFEAMITHERKRTTELADQYNRLVDSVRSIGINKRDPRRGLDLTSTKMYITKLAGLSINEEVKPEQINWAESELLLYTMHSLHLDFEVSGRRWQPNDINDLYNLAYVGKNDLYWTLEKRWIRIITNARMGHYLFSPE
ncbi:MAG: hypothetical protein KA175_07030 [Flavobacteriales bacterium]|nr:hypothetical protein [Flavobacteriales bacterium]MBP6697353.1 hypothetical protein [Flavobacteriales bacterium]